MANPLAMWGMGEKLSKSESALTRRGTDGNLPGHSNAEEANSAGRVPHFFADGHPVGKKVEIGYGPAMCITSDEVAKIAVNYAVVSEVDLLGHYAPSQMKVVYPDHLRTGADEDCREYLAANLAVLKTILDLAKTCHLGVLIQCT